MPFSVIVGAGPGLGASIARCFLRNGHKVALVGRDRDRLHALTRGLSPEGDHVAGFAADAADPAELTDALASARAWGGDIDVLIYNAAAMREVPASSLSFESFMADAAVNLGGALTSVQAVLPGMRARRSGSILFTGGGLALEPYPAWSALAAGKAALRSYAIALHKEVAPENVQVAVVSVCGIVEPGTAFDPDLIAQKYWDLHATAIGRAQREFVYLPAGADPYYSDPQAIHRSRSRPIQT